MPDLARLTDDSGGLTVRVLGPYDVTPGWLSAELVVESGFVAGRLPLVVTRDDLDDWARALERLAAGEPAEWLTVSGRTPEVRIEPEDDVIRVRVDDPPQTTVSVATTVFLEPGWVERLRGELAAVRAAYPEAT